MFSTTVELAALHLYDERSPGSRTGQGVRSW
jgi:hypothetical protein